MTTIRVLIADDEKPGRERLRQLLSSDARVELVGCCSGGTEALGAIRAADRTGQRVDVLFLDIQMPEVDGFAVVASLLDAPVAVSPAVVFVTAHDEHALRAFDAHAIDYLLKPFSDERFDAALDRAIRHVRAGHAQTLMSQMQVLFGSLAPRPTPGGTPSTAAVPRSAPDKIDRIVVKGPHRVRLLPVEQISWIEADGMYVKLHTRDGEVHLHRGLLGGLDASLDERRFVRIHRSAIVDIDLVHELRQDAHGAHVAVLRDRTELRVGRRFRARLEARLGQPL